MKKGLIFIGEAETGKSRTAMQIRKYYGDEAVYLDGRQFKPNGFQFYFKNCAPQTKVVIIDELIKPDYLMSFLGVISESKIPVHPQGKKPFEIQIDKLILVLSSDIKKEDLPKGASFERRFTIVEFPNTSPDFIIDELIDENNQNRTGKSLLLDGLSFLREVSKTDR